jgi:DNA-binding HxlR family transcriptional regulator
VALSRASRLAKAELAGLMDRLGSSMYLEALRALALTPLRWSELKRVLAAKRGLVYNKNLANVLSKLIKMGLVRKEGGSYSVADPVYRHALRGLRSPRTGQRHLLL